MWKLQNKNTRSYAYKDKILNCLKQPRISTLTIEDKWKSEILHYSVPIDTYELYDKETTFSNFSTYSAVYEKFSNIDHTHNHKTYCTAVRQVQKNTFFQFFVCFKLSWLHYEWRQL